MFEKLPSPLSSALLLGDEQLLDALVKPFSLPREIWKCVSCTAFEAFKGL